ncbi:MAG TPA: hypothetical protein VGY54_11440, partial [Polyangiaceae bacterium]|nr:hypothetical protein [Polyangiaceae bacterium]
MNSNATAVEMNRVSDDGRNRFAPRALAVLAASLVVFLGSRAAFAAVGTLDQTGPATNTSFNVDTATLIWQQQIHVGLSGPLAGISITATGKSSSQFNIRVRSGAAPSTQPVLFQQLVIVPAGAMG